MKTHQEIDRRSLEMVRRIVARIDADPERCGLDHAKRVAERWAARGNRSVEEWLTILERPWEEIRAILLDESDQGQRLRQAGPLRWISTYRRTRTPAIGSTARSAIRDRLRFVGRE